jgi:hypothetical protein
VFARDKNIDFLPAIKLQLFMVKYTAVPFECLKEYYYNLSLFLKGGENRDNTKHNNLSPFWF